MTEVSIILGVIPVHLTRRFVSFLMSFFLPIFGYSLEILIWNFEVSAGYRRPFHFLHWFEGADCRS
ncbi:hypothetical protein K443DRAFT_344349 [Laccaria amethystina LaAM-08-1]|uniref:Uncharacterized protein n=1 Tax=Laccaria amethystina LaAM-08-1 TaxID=1095629 RepID=A0A0C9X0E1_9AGAR|nr:hypothetical protein K443DRAFT_344349 [Laccaria amethystina LaAM-08-1]